MKILDRSVYLGPSLYAHFPVIRLTVDLGELEQWPSSRLGGRFIDALLDALPGLREHGCSFGQPGGFVRRLTEDEGTWLGHILEHVALELQNAAGSEVTFGKTRGTGTSGASPAKPPTASTRPSPGRRPTRRPISRRRSADQQSPGSVWMRTGIFTVG